MSDAQAVREYVVRKVTVHVDNTQELYWPVRGAAIAAVQEDMGTGWDRDAFVMMLNGRGQTDRREVAEVVGLAVCDTLRALFEGDDAVHLLLQDLVDLGDREQVAMFGEHFMPGTYDWPADDEDDEA